MENLKIKKNSCNQTVLLDNRTKIDGKCQKSKILAVKQCYQTVIFNSTKIDGKCQKNNHLHYGSFSKNEGKIENPKKNRNFRKF